MAVNKTTEFGAYHISDNPITYNPIRGNNFRLLVQGLDNLLVPGGDENDERDIIRNGQEVLDFSVVSFLAPGFSQSPLEINRGNSVSKYAGKPKWNNGDLVITDYAGVNSKSVLQGWQALSYDVINDTIPTSNYYKKDAVLLEYLPDNTLVRYWELKGCWVSNLREDGYNNDNPQIKKVTATIEFDRALPHLAE